MIRNFLAPLRFRFTEEADVKLYGAKWYTYSEMDIVRLPARRLVDLEAALGMPIVNVLNGARESTVIGDLGACWIGVHLADPSLAGEFDAFAPMIMFVEWEPVPKDDDQGKDGGTPMPPTEGSPPDSTPDQPKVDMVTLPIMPPAE